MSQPVKKCFQLLHKDEIVSIALETIADKDVSSFKEILNLHKAHLVNHIEIILQEVIKNRRKDFFYVLDENDLLPKTDSPTSDNLINPMYALITSGDVEWVELLFKHNLYVTNLESPVFFLLKSRQVWNNISAYKEILQILLKQGLGKNEIYENQTPIFFAAKKEMWHYVEIFLKHRTNIDTFCNGKTARQLITAFNPELLKQTVDLPNNLNPKYQLFEALLFKKENIFVKLLKENPEYSNSEDDTGFTLLQLAIQQRLKQAVYKLLEFGANPNTCKYCNDKNAKIRYLPPVIMALLSGQSEIFIVLIYHHNIDLHTLYNDNNTLYHILSTEWRYLNFKKIKNSVLESVDVLFNACFEFGVNILEKNSSGRSAINIACKSGDRRLIQIFFKYGGFSALKNEKDLKNINPRLLEELFDNCINQHLTKDGGIDYFEIDYGFIDAAIKSKVKSIDNKICEYQKIEQKNSYDSTSTISLKITPEKKLTQNHLNLEMSLLHILSKSKTHVSLLRHPVVKTFLFLKWKKIFPIYLINFIIYLLFTISLSFYVHDYQELKIIDKLNSSNPNNTYSPEDMNILENILELEWILTAIFTIIIILRELSQFSFSKTEYLKSLENYLELSLLATVIYLLLFGPQRELASIAVISAYFELILLIGRYPYISLYITIFIQVVLKSIGLLCIFLPLIFAFAFSFDLIFHDNNNLRTLSTLSASIFQTFMMINGEIEPDKYNLNVSSLLSRLLFIFFFIFIVIAFSNVLNALAISDTQSIINRAKILICIQEVELYSKLEKVWMSFFSRKSRLFIGYYIRYNLNACPQKFTNRTSNFKLETNLHDIPYFTQKIHKYIFGYDRDKVIKKLIKIVESADNKKDYCYFKDDTRYLYGDQDENGTKSDELYELNGDNKISTVINKPRFPSLELSNNEGGESCIYKDIKFLFDNEISNKTMYEHRIKHYLNNNLEQESDETESNNSNEYESIGEHITPAIPPLLPPKLEKPRLPSPLPAESIEILIKQEIENTIDSKINLLAEEMKSKIETISNNFNIKFDALSNDLKEIKLMLRHKHHQLPVPVKEK